MRGKKWLVVVAVVILGLIFCGCDSKEVKEQKEKYAQAQQALEQGDYTAAAAGFNALGDFSDSREMASEAHYLYAKALIDQRDFDSALDELSSIEGYKDQAELYNLCIYEQAMDALNSDRPTSAANLFRKIEGYKDSKDRVAECEGLAWLAKNDWTRAIEYYAEAYDSFSKIEDDELRASYLDRFTILEDYPLLYKIIQSDNFGNSATIYKEAYGYDKEGHRIFTSVGIAEGENGDWSRKLNPFSSIVHIWDHDSTRKMVVDAEVYELDDEGRVSRVIGCNDVFKPNDHKTPPSIDADVYYYVDFSYDESGKVIKEHVLTGSDEADMILTYNEKDQLILAKLDREGGTTINYTYDSQGNLASVHNSSGYTTFNYSYVYDDNNVILEKKVEETYRPAYTDIYTYDDKGRATEIEIVYDEPGHMKTKAMYEYGNVYFYDAD